MWLSHAYSDRFYPKDLDPRCYLFRKRDEIVEAIHSLQGNNIEPHRQVMCVFLDGKAQDIRSRMTHVLKTWGRPYVALGSKRCEPKLVVVFIGKITIVATEKAEKVEEVGKKDSLVLRHSFF